MHTYIWNIRESSNSFEYHLQCNYVQAAVKDFFVLPWATVYDSPLKDVTL